MKKCLAFCFVLLLLAGCTAPPAASAPPPSSGEAAEPEAVWYEFCDMNGEPLTPDTGLDAIEASYTLGWDLDHEGYLRLETGTTSGNAEISDSRSHYYLSCQKDGSIKTLCTMSDYSFYPETAIPGILQVDGHGVAFFPYRAADIPLFVLHPKDKETEKNHVEWTHITTTAGTELEIKPVGIIFYQKDQDTLLDLLGLDSLTEPLWYDVELAPASITVSGFTDGMDWEIFATRAVAYLPSGDSLPDSALTVKEELSFPDLIGRSLLFQMYRYDVEE